MDEQCSDCVKVCELQYNPSSEDCHLINNFDEVRRIFEELTYRIEVLEDQAHVRVPDDDY